MTSVDSQVVFITGGGQGIGAEVARRLHAKGAKLVLTDLDEAALAERSAELGDDEHVLTVVADVRDLAAMQAAAAKAVETFGGIDTVVANAGISGGTSGAEGLKDDQARRIFAINFDGTLNTVQPVLPLMRALFVETNPIPIKQALAFMGKCANELRMPLVPMTAGPADKLRIAMKELRLI